MPHLSSISAAEIDGEALSHSAEVMHNAMEELARDSHAMLMPLHQSAALLNMMDALAAQCDVQNSDILLTGSLYFAGKILLEQA